MINCTPTEIASVVSRFANLNNKSKTAGERFVDLILNWIAGVEYALTHGDKDAYEVPVYWDLETGFGILEARLNTYGFNVAVGPSPDSEPYIFDGTGLAAFASFAYDPKLSQGGSTLKSIFKLIDRVNAILYPAMFHVAIEDSDSFEVYQSLALSTLTRASFVMDTDGADSWENIDRSDMNESEAATVATSGVLMSYTWTITEQASAYIAGNLYVNALKQGKVGLPT